MRQLLSVVTIFAISLAFYSCSNEDGSTPTAKQGISGKVRSTFGIELPNARLVLVQANSAETPVDTTLTNAIGSYQFENIPTGSYRLYCTLEDFTFAMEEVEVIENSTSIVNFALDPVQHSFLYFHVRNAVTKQPMAEVQISGLGNGWDGLTDAQGNAIYDGNTSGDIAFTFAAAGYREQLINYDDAGYSNIIYDTIDLVNPLDYLVAAYYFSGNYNDSTGNGAVGTGNGITWVEDRFGTAGRALHFSGGTDYVSIPNSPALQIPNNTDFTISFWVNTTAQQSSTAEELILDKSTTVAGVFTGISIHTPSQSPGGITATFGTTYGNTYTNTEALPSDGRWHLFTYVLRRAWDVSIYYDGELVTVSEDFNDNLPGNINTLAPLLIGGNGTAKNAFKGKIDDIKIHAIALDKKSVEAVFHENGW